MISVGQKVPDFDFEVYANEETKRIKFSDYSGKWVVLLFYPADFTFVCPTELEEAAGLYEEFKKQGAEVISVSTDTVYSHKAWHDSSPSIKKIKYPMAADPTGRLCRAFGTYIEEEGLSRRATVIIDPQGTVKSLEIHDNSIGRNTHEILRKLEAAIFVSKHKGQVCPASWNPGKKTLTPGLELVGKL